MKKSIAFVLILFLYILPFSGCTSKQTNNSLTVYYNSTVPDSGFVKEAIMLFEETTGIEIKLYEQIPTSATPEQRKDYYHKLNAAIMAGNGPDVYIAFTDFDQDIYKMMEADVFVDFNLLIETDTSFDIERFNTIIMDTGVYFGKRFLIPLSYTVPISFATESKMKEFGVKRSEIESYEGILDTAIRLQKQDLMLFTATWSRSFAPFYGGWLQEVIDFENHKVNIDAKTLDKSLDVIRNEYTLHNKYGGATGYDYLSYISFENGLLNRTFPTN